MPDTQTIPTAFQQRKPLYDDIFGSKPIQYNPIEPADLTVMQDVRNRILKGFADTGKGIADIVPTLVNTVAPDETQVHNVMSKWIDGVSNWAPVFTESGVEDFDFMKHPTAGNFMRGMGSLMGMVMPIGTAVLISGLTEGQAAPAFAEAYAQSGILPAILGMGKAATTVQKAASLTTFGAQMLSSSVDELKNAGITGKSFDYLAPAMAMTGMAAATLAFGGVSKLLEQTALKQIAQGATKATIEDIATNFIGQDLKEVAFKDMIKPVLNSITKRSAEFAKRFAVSGVEGAAEFGAFTGLDQAMHDAGTSLYDSYFSKTGSTPGNGKFGGPAFGSKDEMISLFKNTAFAALSGLMFSGAMGLMHPLNYESTYHVIKTAVDTGDYSSVNHIKAKINQRVLDGKMEVGQKDQAISQIDNMIASMQEFKQKFPDRYAPDPKQRKQLFDLYTQRKQYETLKATMEGHVQDQLQTLDDQVLGKQITGDGKKLSDYYDAQIENTNKLMKEIVTKGAFDKPEEQIKGTLTNTFGEHFPELAPKEEKKAENMPNEQFKALGVMAQGYGYGLSQKGTKGTLQAALKHAMNSYNEHVAAENPDIPKLTDPSQLTEEKIKLAAEAAKRTKLQTDEKTQTSQETEVLTEKPLTNDSSQSENRAGKNAAVQEPVTEAPQTQTKTGKKRGRPAKVQEVKAEPDAPKEQRGSEQPRAPKDYLDAVVAKLKQAFDIDTVVDKAEYDKQKALAGILTDPIAFVTKDGKIVIDPTRARLDTPIHEFGELWLEWTRKMRPELYKRGLDIMGRAPKLLAETETVYPDLGGDALKNEALANAIGKEGVDVFKGEVEEKSLISAFTDWLSIMWDRIKQRLGFAPSEDIARMQLKDFAQRAAKELLGDEKLSSLSGKEIREGATEVLEQRDKDKDGVYLDAQVVANNNSRIYRFFEEPANAVVAIDGVKLNTSVDLSTMTPRTISRYMQWANSHDDTMGDIKPFISKENTHQIAEALEPNTEMAKIINGWGGAEKFGEHIYDEIRDGIWDSSPANDSVLQRDVRAAMMYFKDILSSTDIQNLVGVEDATPKSFIHSWFGKPVIIVDAKPIIAIEPQEKKRKIGEIVKGAVGKDVAIDDAAFQVQHQGLRNAVDKLIAKFKGINKTEGGEEFTDITEDSLDQTRQLTNNPEIARNLIDHYLVQEPLTDAGQKLLSRLERIETIADTQERNKDRYILSTGSYVLAKDFTDKAGVFHKSFSEKMNIQANDAVTKRNATLNNNVIAKLLKPILDVTGVKKVKNYIGKQFHLLGIQSWNIETVGLQLAGTDRSDFYQIIFRPAIETDRHRLDILRPMIESVEVSQHAMEKGSSWQNPDSFSSIEKQEFTTSGDEKHSITKGEFLDIYSMLRREHSRNQILDKVAEDGTKIQGVGVKYTIEENGILKEHRMHLGETDAENIEAIINSTPEYKLTYEETQNGFKMGYDPMNRQHFLRTGTNLHMEENYVPLIHSKEGEPLRVWKQRYVEDINRTKPTGNTGEAFRAIDIFQKYHQYAEDVSEYASKAEPLDNITKFIFFESEKMKALGHEQELKWLNRYVLDMNQTRGKALVHAQKVTNALLKNFSLSRILFNPSPVAKQGISYCLGTTDGMIEAKYLKRYMGNLVKDVFNAHRKYTTGAGAEDILKLWQNHSSMLTMRYKGQFGSLYSEFQKLSGYLSTEATKTVYTKDVVGNMKRIIRLIQTKGLKPIQFVDTADIINLQRAIIDQLKDIRPDLIQGSKEFNETAVRYCEEVVRKTQHGYDPATKTQLQRSNNPIVNALFIFTGQLQKQHNLLVQSYLKYLYDPSGTNFRNVKINMINIGILNSMWVGSVTLLNSQLRGYKKPSDDEGKELFFESVKEFGGNFPMLGTAYNMIASKLDKEKWQKDLTLPQLDVLNQASNAAVDLYKAATLSNGKQQTNFKKGVDQTMRTSVEAAGLPYVLYDMMIPKTKVQK